MNKNWINEETQNHKGFLNFSSQQDLIIDGDSQLLLRDEIDAAKAYNKKAAELNELENTKIKYTLNEID